MTSNPKQIGTRVSQKWVFVVMGFLAIFCAYAMRICLPLTIPKIARLPKKQLEAHSDDSCPIGASAPVFGVTNTAVDTSKSNSSRNAAVDDDETYDWSAHTQGIVLGSFYVGFVPSHLPGGLLAERFGGKHVVGLGMLGTGLLTLLTAPIIRWSGWPGLALLRALAGLFEGAVQPGLTAMLANWVPPSQRASLSSLVFNGASLGMLLFSALLGPMVSAWGWPGPFYVWGGVCCLWWLGWSALCHSSPQRHPYIGEPERRRLEIQMSESALSERAPPLPWRRMLSSGPFWALVVASAGRDWAGYTCMSDLPKYEMGLLRFSVDEMGRLYVCAHVTALVANMLFSCLTDWSIERGLVSRTNARKLMTSIGLTGFGLGNLLSYYAGCDKMLYSVLVLVAMAFGSAGFPGIKVNALDLAPNYAGSVMAMSHGVAGLCGIGAPYLVGILVPNQTLSEWGLVFWIMLIVTVTSNIVFLIFGSGDVQDWNYCEHGEGNGRESIKQIKEMEKLVMLDTVTIRTTKEAESAEGFRNR